MHLWFPCGEPGCTGGNAPALLRVYTPRSLAILAWIALARAAMSSAIGSTGLCGMVTSCVVGLPGWVGQKREATDKRN